MESRRNTSDTNNGGIPPARADNTNHPNDPTCDSDGDTVIMASHGMHSPKWGTGDDVARVYPSPSLDSSVGPGEHVRPQSAWLADPNNATSSLQHSDWKWTTQLNRTGNHLPNSVLVDTPTTQEGTGRDQYMTPVTSSIPPYHTPLPHWEGSSNPRMIPANEMWPLQPDSQEYVPLHPQPRNHQHSFPSFPSGYAVQYHPSPVYMHGREWSHPTIVGGGSTSSLTSGVDGSSYNPYHLHGAIESSIDAASPMPNCIPNTAIESMRHTQLVPHDRLHGQVPPPTMYVIGDGNNMARSLPSSDNLYSSSQDHTSWAGSTQPFPPEIATRVHGERPSRRYPEHAFNLFEPTGSQSDMAINAPLIIPFGCRNNEMRNFKPSRQTDHFDWPVPGHLPPPQQVHPQRETFNSHSTGSSNIEVPSGSHYSTDGGSPGAFPPTSSDEKSGFSSQRPIETASTILSRQERLEKALGPAPKLTNQSLLRLLILVVESPFIWDNEKEPTTDSVEGRALLMQVQSIPGYPSEEPQRPNASIFSLFVEVFAPDFRCLICGKHKQSMARGIGCVRSHLEHKPYPCNGLRGCKSCPKDGIVRRFCSASSLHDHRKKQEERRCPSCGETFTVNSIARHRAKHQNPASPED